jgi:hypothetical protein
MTDKKGVICFDCAKSDPQYREIAEYIDACVRMTEARIAREAENGKK